MSKCFGPYLTGRGDSLGSVAVVLSFALSLMACGQGDGEESALSEQRMDFRTVLSIGAVDGPEEQVVFRAFAGFRRADRIFVAHGGGPEVRVYDLEGTLLDRVGRMGRGPGEFRHIRWVAPIEPDSFVVLDARASQLLVFRNDGTFARAVRLASAGPGEEQWVGIHRGAMVIARSRLPDPRSLAEGIPTRDSLVVSFMPRGSLVPTTRLGPTTPIPNRYWQMEEQGTGFSLRVVEDGPRAMISGNANLLVVASSDRPEVLRWNGDSWESVHLRGIPVDPVAPPSVPGIPANIMEYLAAGPNGTIWVGLAESDGRDFRRWVLFDGEGVAKQSLDLPSGFSIWDAGRDWLLGRRVDSLGVEYVELLEIEEV